MKKILIFAGTTEGRKLSECLASSGILHTLCVATEYGAVVLKEHPLRDIHRGRMDEEEIKKFIENGEYGAVVDATHPYAELVTKNIKAAMQKMSIPCLRLKRELDTEEKEEGVLHFETNEACAEALKEISGNILLTTGSRELATYCVSETVKSRLFVRVLPGLESLSLCTEQGIKGKQIIAMQGPFTAEMNTAVIHQFQISCLVTKQSGTTGGYLEKLQAAAAAGIVVCAIGHPKEAEGYSFAEVCGELEKLCGCKIKAENKMEITLAGIGMGNKKSLTKEVLEKIEEADILLGAKRMLEPYTPRLEKRPFYLAKQIIPYLQEAGKKHPMERISVVVLFSGDSGFYSGCQALSKALQEAVNAGWLNADIKIMPGISSVAYLSARIGESYEDAAILSMHGKELHNLARRIKTEDRTYLLMSGAGDVNRLGEALVEAGLTGCEITTGYQLSYEEEQIKRRTPEECQRLTDEGLYTCFVKNPDAVHRKLTHGMSDGAFIRDKVPMTKEEIREVSICKLKLHSGAVVYDIGSGTGSIAVETAALSDDIQVYAIEQKKEAAALIVQNKEKFELENITVVEKKAPEGLRELPRATHAFLGGSGGNLKEIISCLHEINKTMRVVINAVTLETLCEIKQILASYPVENEEIVQMQVNRMKKAGSYHLMQAENPVWICAFDLKEQ